ncbi:MAG: isoprenylcysteine carboxylmethyltransferase family protein, partial [Planctomycetes bacterium]|nr:isoprenylcysteine carboxylmethyltransferase family protein [Planctomycetota bacterium]
ANKRHSGRYRIASFCVAIFFFMVLVPILYLLVGRFVNQWLTFSCPRNIEFILAGLSGIIGPLILLWSVWTQWTVGHGGPVPVVAPTKKLITCGPYALCRNPIYFGGFFYVFAFGLVFGNLSIAVICIVLEAMIGIAYLKGIEEKELLLRFGEEYQCYKERTPFLIPRFWKR